MTKKTKTRPSLVRRAVWLGAGARSCARCRCAVESPSDLSRERDILRQGAVSIFPLHLYLVGERAQRVGDALQPEEPRRRAARLLLLAQLAELGADRLEVGVDEHLVHLVERVAHLVEVGAEDVDGAADEVARALGLDGVARCPTEPRLATVYDARRYAAVDVRDDRSSDARAFASGS